MTSFSLRALERAPDADPATFEDAAYDGKIAQSLSLHARDVGPYGLSAWAQRHGLQCYYVDNCWVRVPVRGSDLQTFFDEELKGAVRPGDTILPDGLYLIEAEEF